MRAVIVAGCAAVVAGYLSVGVAAAEECYLPPGLGIPPRTAPAGMDNYMWPPCEPTYHQWQVPIRGSLPGCPDINGTPGELWCIYTNPDNGKQYVIGRGINQRIQ